MPASDASPGRSGGPAGGDGPRAIFGLNPAEMDLLNRMFGEMAGRMGLDGERIIAGLGRGEPLCSILSLPPRLVETLYARAHTWFTAGRIERAETLFQALCMIDGRNADHWVGYGVCLRKRGAEPEAVLAFSTAAAVRPDWAVPHFHAADLAAAQQLWSLAEDHLAAFAARSGGGVPEQMQAEAAKLTRALKLRAELRRGSRDA